MTKPCASNDNLPTFTNDSNDWVVSNTRGKGQGQGSGCDDAEEEVLVEASALETDPAAEPEEEPEEEEYSTSNVTTDPAPTFLSCSSTNAQDITLTEGVERVDLAYDYEIHTTKDVEDVLGAVDKFEHDLLNTAIGKEFSLVSCESVRQRRSLSKNGNGRRLGGGSVSSVVGAEMYPSDQEDSINTECTMNVDSSIQSSSSCTPMKGYMTAWVQRVDDRDRRHLSESNMYTVIQAYSAAYSNTQEGVLAVSYIGDRSDLPNDTSFVPVIEKAISEGGQRDDLVSAESRGLTGNDIAGIACGSILGLLAILALVVAMKKKRRSRNKQNQAEKQEDASASSVVNELFMIDNNDEEDSMIKGMTSEVSRDDTSNSSQASVDTEDHTFDETIAIEPSATFESEDPEDGPGFEVNI